MNARNSWQPTRDERLAFWRDCYALSAFRDVHDYIPRWEGRDPADIGLRRALEAAILVSYARPFKQQARVRLEEGVIPSEFKATHDEAVGLRDKVIAHRDTDGPSIGGWNSINDLLLSMEDRGLIIQTCSPALSHEAVIPLMEQRTEGFRMKIYPLLGEGWFKINLAESPNKLAVTRTRRVALDQKQTWCARNENEAH